MQGMFDKLGRLVVTEQIGQPVQGDAGPITDTTPTTLVAAQGSGVRAYLTNLIISNSSVTDTVVALSGLDSGVTMHFPAAGSMGGCAIEFNPPLASAPNTALVVTCLTTGTSTYVSGSGYAY
jgi:hypothetical protein